MPAPRKTAYFLFRTAPWVGLAIVAIYLLAFREVPIYYDEVSMRRYFGRGWIDGFLSTNIFPVCDDILVTPWLFIPPHMLFSWVDGWLNWHGIRSITIGAHVIFAATAMLGLYRAAPASGRLAAWSVAGAYIGVAGASYVFWRNEFIMILYAALCLATWFALKRGTLTGWLRAALLCAHLGMLWLATFTHLQGILLAPVSFVLCMLLVKPRPVWAIPVTLFIMATTLQSIHYYTFECKNDPALEQAIRTTNGAVRVSTEKDDVLPVVLARRAVHYTQQFWIGNHAAKGIPLPEPANNTGRVLNVLNSVVVAFTAMAMLVAMGICSLHLWRTHRPTLSLALWRSTLNALAADGRAIWLLAALIWLAYCLQDVGATFYRSHFRHALGILLLAIALAHATRPWQQRFLSGWAWLCVGACATSAAFAWWQLAPKLAAGFEGHFVSMQRDWSDFNKRTRALALRCELTSDTPRLMVDNATYRALWEYPRVIDYYYGRYHRVLKQEPQPQTPAAWLRDYAQLRSPGYVTLCRAQQFIPLPVDHRDGEICCYKFKR